MEDKKSAKIKVIAAIEKNGGNLSFRELESSTELSFEELSVIIGSLAKENRLLIRINHFAKGACLYKSSQDALYARFMDLLFVYWKSHATFTLLAKQDCPLWLQYD